MQRARKNLFEFIEHYPYAPRSDGVATERLWGFGTPGEVVSLSFSLRAADDVAEIEISAGALAGAHGLIESKRIEIYVVKVWDVSGVGNFQGARMSCSELLLKDDRAPLDDGYVEHPCQGAGSADPLWLYRAPDVRLAGNARTSLIGGEQKQIWFSVKLPCDARAGSYRGVLEIRTPQGVACSIPLELQVLPFSLMKPSQDLMIWYRGSLDKRESQFFVSEQTFRAHLKDIYDHGFRSISICERDRATAQIAVDIAEEIGFDRHIVFRTIPANAEALRFGKLSPIFYLSDELDARLAETDALAPDAIAEHKGNGAYCAMLGWQSMASLVDREFIKRMMDDCDIGYVPTILALDIDAIHGN